MCSIKCGVLPLSVRYLGRSAIVKFAMYILRSGTNYVSSQGGGVEGEWKMLTMDDKGGRRGKANADNG